MCHTYSSRLAGLTCPGMIIMSKRLDSSGISCFCLPFSSSLVLPLLRLPIYYEVVNQTWVHLASCLSDLCSGKIDQELTADLGCKVGYLPSSY